jgi:hypothetical protein
VIWLVHAMSIISLSYLYAWADDDVLCDSFQHRSWLENERGERDTAQVSSGSELGYDVREDCKVSYLHVYCHDLVCIVLTIALIRLDDGLVLGLVAGRLVACACQQFNSLSD